MSSSSSHPQLRVVRCSSCGTAVGAPLTSDAPPCPRCSSSSSSLPRRPPLLSDSPPPSPLPSDAPPSSSSSSPLSPAEVDRHLEARLQSLSSRPVAVYLPTPSTSQLHSRLQRLLGEQGPRAEAPSQTSLEDRLQRLSRGAAASGTLASPEELEQRLRRLRGEEAESKATPPVVPLRSAPLPRPPAGGEVSADDLELLLRQLNEEVKMDLVEVQRVSQLLAQPLRQPTLSTSTTLSRPVQLSPPPVDVDDPQRLMEHLQSLPSTAVLQLQQQAKWRGGEEEEVADDDEERAEAAQADDIVRQAVDEVRMQTMRGPQRLS